MCTDVTPVPDPLSAGAPASAPDDRVRRAPAAGPWVLGLAGPAGAGKSLIAAALAADGARVLDADRIAREITERDPDVRAGLAAEYGAGVYRADGTLDRAAVAARVFSDPEALARLNRLVHPRLVARLREGIADAARDGFAGTLVVDAALLFDWGFERDCDAVLAVVAPEALQVERLTAARGWSAHEARRRIANARGAASFRALADDVVVNDASPAAAVAAARAAVARLRAARREGGAR
jgi:dephospho-CoA kinase